MAEPLIVARTEGELHHVIINRPEKRNALTPEMLEQLAAAVAQADELPARPRGDRLGRRAGFFRPAST